MNTLRFHHLGVACADLNSEVAQFELLGYTRASEEFVDPLQGVRGIFLSAPMQPSLELLCNLRGSTVLDPWLKRKVKFYHFAYETSELESTISQFKTARAKLIVTALPAVAFEERRVAFLMLPNRMLLELIEGLDL